MNFIDVFNGDADGICALHQLRLAKPLESKLVTGVKRDINLLKKVHAKAEDNITVLDISLDKNKEELQACLNAGARVLYFDHHFAGDIPQDKNLEAHIDTDANMCTSLLVNDYLHSQYLAWAVTAAFGDNLFVVAEEAAKPLNLSAEETQKLISGGEAFVIRFKMPENEKVIMNDLIKWIERKHCHEKTDGFMGNDSFICAAAVCSCNTC